MAEKHNVDYKPVTAQVKAASLGQSQTDKEAAELAEEAGVVNPAHVDYEEALKNYESRDDVETLANRRAREGAADFGDQSFVRTNDPSGVVTAESATQEDVEEAEKAKGEQAKATADAAEERNEPESTIETDEDEENK